MADSNQNDIEILNHLIAKTLDSAQGYQEAAKDEETGEYRDIFHDMAFEREQVVDDLQAAVRQLGGEPDEKGTLLGTMHRTFTFISAISTEGDTTLIKRVEGGEDHLRDVYQEALSKDLGAVARQAISEANISVTRGHDKVSQLKARLTT